VVRLIRRGSPPQKHCINPDCESNKQATSVGVCPECGKTLRLLFSRAGKRFIGCSGYPECKRTYPLPQFGSLKMTGEVCDACRAPIALVMNRGRPWKFCVNMECPKREKKAEKKADKAAESKEAKPKKVIKKKAKKPEAKPETAKKKATSPAKARKPAKAKKSTAKKKE
jgi:DNA topoisomerase-1